MSKSGPIALGLVGMVVGGGAAVLPISDDYSQFGFGIGDEVTLECGNPFSDEVQIRDGGLGITFADRIFELDDGRVVNASAACEDSRSNRRIFVFGGLIGGAVLFLVGLLWPSPAAPPSRSSRHPARPQPPSSSQPPPPRPNQPTQPGKPQQAIPPEAGVPSSQQVSGGSRGSGTPIDPAAVQPGTPAAPVPPSQRSTAPEAAGGVAGGAWWDQPLDGVLPDASPLPESIDGPMVDPSLAAAPPAPIPDSVVGSFPPSPVSGRLAPSADPTPAAAPAPIPDVVSGEFVSPASGGDNRAWGVRTDEPDDSDEATVSDQAGTTARDTSPGVTIPADRIEQFQLSDGRLLLVDDVSVVGRMPAPPVSYPDAVLVAVEDRTVSKSHAAFGRTGGELWVEDLHSRNGLVVIRHDGSRHDSPPGETTPLAVGDSVRLGDQTTLTVTLGVTPLDDSTERRTS